MERNMFLISHLIMFHLRFHLGIIRGAENFDQGNVLFHVKLVN